MMAIVTLDALLARGRPATNPIAYLGDEPVTLERWRADIVHNAERLAALHIRRGALICEEGYWFIVGLLALIRIGARVILPPNEQPGTVRGLQPEFDVLVTDSAPAAMGDMVVLESSADKLSALRCDLAQNRIGFFTSGSTGEIKQVPKTLRHFELEAEALEARWGAQLDAVRIFGTVTHQHVFGMTFRLMWPLLAGRPFQSEFHIAWEPLLALLTPRAVIVSSPAQLSRLGGLSPLTADQRPSMVITAGAPLPEAAAEEAEAIFGHVPTEIYGSTEAGVIGWRDSTTQPVLWRPFSGVEVKAGMDGVLLLRSRHASIEGWCEQADRISLNDDGRFHLEGRVDRIAKIEGKRVSLDRLEHSVIALPWIEEAAVVVIGENPVYLGVVARLAAAGEDAIRRMGKFRFERHLRRELAQTEDAAVLPRRWRFVETVPVDGLGKRRLSDLQALFDKSV
jgi:acyl-coenzyme A synthetase/AMP-(fatty) acid ligase